MLRGSRLAPGSRVVRSVLAAALVLALAACQQGIPSAGDVQVGLTDLNAAEQPVIFTPSGPADGATPAAIVRGFINAASSAVDDYAIARSFLSSNFAEQWDPRERVVIDERTRSTTLETENLIEITIAPRAELDHRGILTFTPPATNETLRYQLERIDGEWRITQAPAGILLDRATFSLVFNQHTLYFVQPRTENLVPDPRWFAVGPTTATEIVTELLAGPSPQLSGGVVVSGFPEDAALAADSVPVENGTALIDLNPAVASADRDALQLARAQLSASLQTVTGVTSAVMSVEQAAFTNTDVQRGAPIATPQVSPLPVVQLGAELGELSGVTLISLGVWVRAVVATDPTEVIIRDGNRAAVMLSAAGLSWVDDQGQVTRLDSRASLASPTLDRQDVVWSSQTTVPSQVLLSRVDGTRSELQTTWPTATAVRALRISRDGTRLAALLETNGQASIAIAGVLRDENGFPIGLTESTVINWPAGEARDIDWMNAQQLVVATQPPSGNVRITGIGAGLFETESGSSPNIVGISGANTRAELTAISQDGVIRTPQGVTWRQVVRNITLLAKRG